MTIDRIILPENVLKRLEDEETFPQGVLFGVNDGDKTILISSLFMPLSEKDNNSDYAQADFQTIIPLIRYYQQGVFENLKENKSQLRLNSASNISILPFFIYEGIAIEEIIGTAMPIQISAATKDLVNSVLYLGKHKNLTNDLDKDIDLTIATAKNQADGFSKITYKKLSLKAPIPEEAISTMNDAISEYEQMIYSTKNLKYSRMFLIK